MSDIPPNWMRGPESHEEANYDLVHAMAHSDDDELRTLAWHSEPRSLRDICRELLRVAAKLRQVRP